MIHRFIERQIPGLREKYWWEDRTESEKAVIGRLLHGLRRVLPLWCLEDALRYGFDLRLPPEKTELFVFTPRRQGDLTRRQHFQTWVEDLLYPALKELGLLHDKAAAPGRMGEAHVSGGPIYCSYWIRLRDDWLEWDVL